MQGALFPPGARKQPGGDGRCTGVTRRRRLLLAWALGLTPLLVVLAIVAGAGLRGRGPADVDQSRAGPVLLVSGYGGSTSSLESLAARLREEGLEAIVVPPVGDNTGDLTQQARALDRVARTAIAAGAPSVDVVGYSAGGVVSRIWVADLDGDTIARRVVTLGSPHGGTEVARLAAGLGGGSCPLACRQLATGSDLLDALPQAPAGPRWVSIWTADDDVVVPPTASRLDGAVNIELQQVCTDARVGHGQLPTDALSTALVLDALDGPGLMQAPDPSACAALRAG